MGGRAIWALAAVLLFLTGPTAALAASAHYDLDARFDAAKGRLEATVGVRLPPGEAGRETVFFLSRRFALEPVKASGGVVSVEPAETPLRGLNRITIRYPEAPTRPVNVRFRYAGPIDDPGDAPSFSAERVELNLEHAWLPIRNDLTLYFTAEAKLSGLPKGVIVVAQGDVRQAGTTVRIRRTDTDNDLTIIGAPGLKRLDAPDVSFWAAEPEDPLVAILHKHAVASAAFYRKLYGAPEGPAVRMVIVPRASTGGYARSSFIVMPTFRKPGDPLPKFDEPSPARFVAHEFCHTWLKHVAPGGENYWVSESVAEYMAMRYVEQAFGPAERDAMLARKREVAAKAGPMVAERRPTNAALYQKGPVLLFDLEAKIGRPAMDRLLVRRDRPRTSAEFLAALGEIVDPATARAFGEALKIEGLPKAAQPSPSLSVIPAKAGTQAFLAYPQTPTSFDKTPGSPLSRG